MEEDQSDRLGIAKQHIHRAENSLKAAMMLLESELHADSLSRSYYTAYHASYASL